MKLLEAVFLQDAVRFDHVMSSFKCELLNYIVLERYADALENCQIIHRFTLVKWGDMKGQNSQTRMQLPLSCTYQF